ncbi:MAG TPA: energy transducer TonB [Gammaproteobacteria bacterium]|jgi:TonB family protein
MLRVIQLWLFALFVVGGATEVSAQWRCDCTTIVAGCTAEVTAMERWIDVRTDTPQCARVDYFVDGLPFVTTVVEGESRLDWISPRAEPDILIQSCQVCADQADALAAERTEGSNTVEAEDARLEPLLRWSPQYPPVAQRNGVEGHVTLEFDVTPQGTVENPTVLESEPAQVFDQAALAAVRRWRYVTDEQRPVTSVTERLEFALAEMLWQLAPPADGATQTATAGMPRNRCVREDAVYNFGDMVEAGLMNACAEPLLVFGCAEGVGRDVGRWVCTDSESLESLLVRPGDERIGTTVRPSDLAPGVSGFGYSDSFFLARAPNSQYWWIACDTANERCRENARMWVRSMNRQPASVDPRGRASITLAQSY